MSNLVFFDDVTGEGYGPNEAPRIAYLTHLPEIGDRVSMGSDRLWPIIAIDRYSNQSHLNADLFIAYANRTGPLPRSNWFWLSACAHRPRNLELYLGNEQLLSTGVTLNDERPEVSTLLPHYNPQARSVSSQPWGIETVATFLPAAEIAQPCYSQVYLLRCVYVSEAASPELTALQSA